MLAPFLNATFVSRSRASSRPRSRAGDARWHGTRSVLPRGHLEQVKSVDQRRGRWLQDLRHRLRHWYTLPGFERSQRPRAHSVQLGRCYVRERVAGQDREILGSQNERVCEHGHASNSAWQQGWFSYFLIAVLSFSLELTTESLNAPWYTFIPSRVEAIGFSGDYSLHSIPISFF